MNNLVIIGFGSAGYAALMAAKKTNPACEITVIDSKGKDLLHPCGLPYSLEGIVDDKKLTEDISFKKMGVEKIRGRAKQIDYEAKKINVITESGIITVPYSTVIIATGNHPLVPSLPGLDSFQNQIHTLTSADDLNRIKSNISENTNACVIGGGAIGIETAFALRDKCSKVILFEKEENILPGVLDSDISELVYDYLVKSGIDVMLNTEITSFNGKDHLKSVSYGKEKIPVDECILAAGFRPDISLAGSPESPDSGPDFDIYGYYVDRKLKTSVKDVYAAGDCISLWSIIDGTPINAMLATSAFKQGTIAGINASGGSAEYYGSAGTFVTKTGELEIAGTGYTMESAKERGYKPVFGKIKTRLYPEYYPDDTEITVKIIADKDSERILGAQAVGTKGAAWRINTVSTCMEFAIPLSEINRIELAYCPAVSDIQDPLQKAAEFALRKIRKRTVPVQNLN